MKKKSIRFNRDNIDVNKIDLDSFSDEFIEKFVNDYVDKFIDETFKEGEAPDALVFALHKDLEEVHVRNLNKNKESYTLKELESACDGLLNEVRPIVEEYKTKYRVHLICNIMLVVAILIKLFIIK